jgi:hypothetical protein
VKNDENWMLPFSVAIAIADIIQPYIGRIVKEKKLNLRRLPIKTGGRSILSPPPASLCLDGRSLTGMRNELNRVV